MRLEAGDCRLEDREKKAIKAGGTSTLIMGPEPNRERAAIQ